MRSGTEVALAVGLFLVGHSAGLALAHALQWIPKRKLGAAAFLQVQQSFYVAYGPVAGLLEMGSFVACGAAVAMIGSRSPALFLAIAALGCLTLMFLVWALLVQPINIKVSKWRADTMPEDWASIGRDRWHMLHAIRLVLAAAALGCLIGSAFSGR